MGERERGRRVTDGYAIRSGIFRSLIVTLGLYGTLWFGHAVFEPVVRQFTGAVRVPVGLTTLGVLTCVGLPFGWARMRSSGRLVADADAEPVHGSRALAVAIANRRAASNDQFEHQRVQVHGSVRLWSPGLLHGGDLHPTEVEQAVTEQPTNHQPPVIEL